MSVACAKIALVVFAVNGVVVMELAPETPATAVEIALVQAALEYSCTLETASEIANVTEGVCVEPGEAGVTEV